MNLLTILAVPHIEAKVHEPCVDVTYRLPVSKCMANVYIDFPVATTAATITITTLAPVPVPAYMMRYDTVALHSREPLGAVFVPARRYHSPYIARHDFIVGR